MKKETVFSLIRTLLSAVGAFLIGKNLFGTVVDPSTLETIVGVLMGITSVVWSIFDKSLGIEMLQSVLKQVVVFVGGFLIALNKLTPNNLEAILGLVTALTPFLYSILSRKKSTEIVNNTIDISKLKTSTTKPKS